MHFQTLLEKLAQLWLTLGDAAVKSTIVLFAAAVLAAALRNSSAARRHVVWLLALMAVLAIPGFSALLPRWSIPFAGKSGQSATRAPGSVFYFRDAIFPHAGTPEALGSDATSTAGAGTAIAKSDGSSATDRTILADVARDLRSFIVALWLAGTITMSLPIALGLISVRRLERRCECVKDGPWRRMVDTVSEEIGLRRDITIFRSGERNIPMTWGLWQPKLLVPADGDHWPAQRRRAVILHELTHIQRNDCLAQLLAQFARCVYWFNPLCWWAVQRLKIERELACDDAVLSSGMPATDYAEQLLQLATSVRGRYPAAALAMARPSKLRTRLTAILDPKRRRDSLGRLEWLAAIVLSAALVIPMSALRPATTVAAQVSGDPAVMSGQLPPIGADTTFLLRLDLKSVTPASLKATARVMAANNAADIAELVASYQPYFDALVHHGATAVWISASTLKDRPNAEIPYFHVQLAADADPKQMEAELQKIPAITGATFDRAGEFLVIRQKSAAAIVPDDKTRQAFSKALSLSNPADGMALAIVPNDAMRESLQQVPKDAPAFASLAGGILRESGAILFSATLGETPGFSARVDCPDAKAAAATSEKVDRMLTAMNDELAALRRHELDQASAVGNENAAKVATLVKSIKGMKCAVRENVVEIVLDERSLATVGNAAGALVANARQNAAGMASMSNIKQLALGVIIYSTTHDGKLPDRLEDVKESLGGDETFKKLLTDPSTGQSPGYIYEKPADKLTDVKNPSGAAMIFESIGGKKREGGIVGYADGHVAVVPAAH